LNPQDDSIYNKKRPDPVPVTNEEETPANEMGFNESYGIESVVSLTFSDQMKEYESQGERETRLTQRNSRRL